MRAHWAGEEKCVGAWCAGMLRVCVRYGMAGPPVDGGHPGAHTPAGGGQANTAVGMHSSHGGGPNVEAGVLHQHTGELWHLC
jgi:hypothetical protein